MKETALCCGADPGPEERISGVPGWTTKAFDSEAFSPPVWAVIEYTPTVASGSILIVMVAAVELVTLVAVTVIPLPRLNVVVLSQCVLLPVTLMVTLDPCSAVFGEIDCISARLGVTEKA